MRAFVSGGGGFLGQHLCRALREQGWLVDNPCSAECDLTREVSLAPWSGYSYDRIFHLAAWTQAGDFCLRHPGEQWLINQSMNTRILDWWHRDHPQAKFIAIGTSCAYDPDLPLVEANYLRGTPIDGLITYAMTKRMLHVGLLALSRQFGLRFLNVIPSTLYGPGYHTDGRQMHFIFDLIRKILRGKMCGDEVTLWGDGMQQREVVHVDDFVRILMELDRGVENELINIGSGEEYTIRDFARRICVLVDYPSARIQYDLSRYVGAKSKCLDVTKLRTLIPDLGLTPLDKGLEETIHWFMNNQETFLSGETP
jgi:GDP-L-fucose synthase